jgi:hypothetical protein
MAEALALGFALYFGLARVKQSGLGQVNGSAVAPEEKAGKRGSGLSTKFEPWVLIMVHDDNDCDRMSSRFTSSSKFLPSGEKTLEMNALAALKETGRLASYEQTRKTTFPNIDSCRSSQPPLKQNSPQSALSSAGNDGTFHDPLKRHTYS